VFRFSATLDLVSVHTVRFYAKKMPNYRPNGRRRLGRPFKRILDEAETGLSIFQCFTVHFSVQ